jgi:chromosome segregation ATPase
MENLIEKNANLKSEYIKNNQYYNETLAILTFLREQTEHYEQQISQCLKRKKQLKQLISDIEQQKSQLPTIARQTQQDDSE